ncbi:MAG: LacI family DNA-binding transcriptional regulator [Bacteroidota bacterium]
MTTMKDIAKVLGLNESTVSRALNNHPYVRPETREKVIAAARRMNYRPNTLARSLATSRSYVVGLVISNIANLFFAEVTKGIEEVADAHGYSVILCDTGRNPAKELKYLDLLARRQVDGIIFMSGRLPADVVAAIKQQKCPVVTISRDGTRHGIPTVRINNRAEAAKATRYLINLGHRRIGFISGQLDDTESGLPRLEGYRGALEESGIEYDPAIVQEGDFRLESGMRACARIMQATPRPTAIFAANDEMAIGAMKALSQLGLNVPADVAVVGFDDTAFATVVTPPLTTIAQPLRTLGTGAMETLLKLMAGQRLAEIETVLECQLVVRASCGGTRL